MNQTPLDINKLRDEIDLIDHQIQDLLAKRCDLVNNVSAYKKANKIKICIPAREADLMRKILNRHNSPLHKVSLLQIWREMIGAYSLMQGRIKVAIAGNRANDQYMLWHNARDYFGASIPMISAQNHAAAINLVREKKAQFAVVPCLESLNLEDNFSPQNNGTTQQNFWSLLMDSNLHDRSPAIKILAKLPFVTPHDKDKKDHPCLIIGRYDFVQSEGDNSFVYAVLDSQTSRSKLINYGKKSGIKIIHIQTIDRRADESHHLIEIDGFLDKDDPRLSDFHKSLAGPSASIDTVKPGQIPQIIPIGGYPVPPQIIKNAYKAGDR